MQTRVRKAKREVWTWLLLLELLGRRSEVNKLQTMKKTRLN